MSDERLDEIAWAIEHEESEAHAGIARDLLAEVRRLRREYDWVKTVVMHSADVDDESRAEIARACGWPDA